MERSQVDGQLTKETIIYFQRQAGVHETYIIQQNRGVWQEMEKINFIENF